MAKARPPARSMSTASRWNPIASKLSPKIGPIVTLASEYSVRSTTAAMMILRIHGSPSNTFQRSTTTKVAAISSQPAGSKSAAIRPEATVRPAVGESRRRPERSVERGGRRILGL